MVLNSEKHIIKLKKRMKQLQYMRIILLFANS